MVYIKIFLVLSDRASTQHGRDVFIYLSCHEKLYQILQIVVFFSFCGFSFRRYHLLDIASSATLFTPDILSRFWLYYPILATLHHNWGLLWFYEFLNPQTFFVVTHLYFISALMSLFVCQCGAKVFDHIELALLVHS